ncbi:methylmalonyl-CoA mutase [Methylocystis rosea]|uniref:Methylmalonyl-CoA mutase n=1 Tax=Methylocystis rosea TaxID=173366 RepID=A0ABX6EMB9_9HYPH|nr:methylmalonyl-CoA mutase subunit beta [Methylocystis rosea]QGM95070.1 methylmalonyl-CoA mutase [Methylocystis rosea]
MTGQETALAGVFPQATDAQWRALVERALKGASFETLVSKSYDGLSLEPIYARAAGSPFPVLRKNPGRWAILARVDVPNADAANRLALQDLDGGADGLHLVFAGSIGAYGGGLVGDDDDAIAHALANVRLDYGIPLTLDSSPRAPGAAQALMRFVDRQHIEPSLTRVSMGFDPLGAQARHGFAAEPWTQVSQSFARDVKAAADAGFVYATAVADARVVHSAGGTESQELAFALSSALAYLRALADAGVELDAARGLIAFRFCADADELLGVAKFRAARRLWARVEEACGLSPKPALVFAETAWRMMARRDPWNNILRGTLAAFSAAIGGADAVSVLPFTQALGAPDEFARRLARDTQLVLQDESHIDAVDDPTSGAGGFEALTDALCARAWGLFQQIEADGGLPTALETGVFQAGVAEAAALRAKNVARAKDKLIGANQFPDIHEGALDVLAPYDAAAETVEPPTGARKSVPLAPRRLAEPFERLREESDVRRAELGDRPKIFLANLGPVAAFTARANFAKNFFEAGGVEAVFGPETESTTELVDAYRESGAKLACLCSSDRIYGDSAETAALALKGAGAGLYLAGRPGELEERLRHAGVTGFIYAGCDMHGALRRALSEAK